jgi:hypothetical protein
MTKKSLIKLLSFFLFSTSVFAKDIVVYGGSAEYKGQVGGGVYDLAGLEYYNGANGAFMLKLFFDKKRGKFIPPATKIKYVTKFAFPEV